MAHDEEEAHPGVVYDCMVFLQGAARPSGPAAACLELVQDERVSLFLTPRILAEIRDVLTRPKLQRKFPVLTQEYVEAFLKSVLSKATVIMEVASAFDYDRDPKDEPYINLALTAKAQFIVSRDNDLLALMEENRQEGKDFRTRFPELEILDPVAFLRYFHQSLSLSDEQQTQ